MSTTTTFTLVALIIAFTSSSTLATETIQINSQQILQVDPLNGALIVNATDTFGQHILQRRYNSRSLFHGLFGIGWCTDLDMKILIKSPTIISLYFCSTEPITLNYNKEHARFETLDSEKLWLDRRGVRGYRLFDQRSSTAAIKQIDFDSTGRPIQIDRTVIEYSNDGTIELKQPDTHLALIITLNESRITKASITHSISINYEYSEQRLTLVRATNLLSTSEYKYQYDESANLTTASETRPPRSVASTALTSTVTAITYSNDLVTQVENGICSESFTYSTLAETDAHDKSVSVQTACRNKPISHQTYEYYFHTGDKNLGSHILDKVKIKGDNT